MKPIPKRPAKRRALLSYLSPTLPMAITAEGLSLVFTRNLTEPEVTKVFDLFPVITNIETPSGYYLRRDWPGKEPLDPTCTAARIAKVIVEELTRAQ